MPQSLIPRWKPMGFLLDLFISSAHLKVISSKKMGMGLHKDPVAMRLYPIITGGLSKDHYKSHIYIDPMFQMIQF